MSIEISNLAIVLLLSIFSIVLFLVFLLIKQNKIINSLHVIDENQRKIAQNEINIINQNQENNMKFWYEKLSLLDEKQIRLSQKVHEQIEKNVELFASLQSSQIRLEKNIEKILFKRLEDVSEKVDKRLELINQKVENRLNKGFENIDITFKKIVEGIVKINEAQKNIESLSTQVNSLQDVLTDKKSRGIFGEVQLNSILDSIFGQKQELYSVQHKLSNGFIVDASIKAPKPMGQISIDSKFPLENFRKIDEDKSYIREFKKDMKNHIDAISSKYIIPNETADMAVLFLPAEAIFAHVNAYNEDIIDYARSKNVWIASPTTLMALLSTILAVVKDIKTRQQARKIQEELAKLATNFSLYKKRWENLSRHIDSVHKDVKDITTTTSKISNEFERIQNVDLDRKEIEE